MHSMRSYVHALALAGTVLLLAAGPLRAAETSGDRAEAAFREAREYTVRIRTRIETPFLEDEQGAYSGAGFLVDATRGWIVTNAHVVGRGPAEIQVAFWGEAFHPARKIYVDSFSDVAIVAVDLAHPRRAALLDPSARPTVGEPVGAFGHPLDIPFTGTRGIVSGYTDQFGPGLLQIDATIDHGNSGGPVIALGSGGSWGSQRWDTVVSTWRRRSRTCAGSWICCAPAPRYRRHGWGSRCSRTKTESSRCAWPARWIRRAGRSRPAIGSWASPEAPTRSRT